MVFGFNTTMVFFAQEIIKQSDRNPSHRMRNGQQVWANLPNLVIAVSAIVPIGDRFSTAICGKIWCQVRWWNVTAEMPGRLWVHVVFLHAMCQRAANALPMHCQWFYEIDWNEMIMSRLVSGTLGPSDLVGFWHAVKTHTVIWEFDGICWSNAPWNLQWNKLVRWPPQWHGTFQERNWDFARELPECQESWGWV